MDPNRKVMISDSTTGPHSSYYPSPYPSYHDNSTVPSTSTAPENLVSPSKSTKTAVDQQQSLLEKRKFACSFEGCNKSFNRRDYLERHAANHLPVKPFLCRPCNRHFARGDLYEK